MNVPISDEHKLVQLLKAGDKLSFETLYKKYGSRLTGYLIKITKSEYLAAEILQETFLRIWNTRDKIDPSLSFRSYLFKIASNLVYDFFRKASRDAVLQKQLIEKASENTMNDQNEFLSAKELSLLQNAIKELPPKRRLIFELIKLEERSYSEVSSLLNISVSTINDHIVKATRFLKEKLIPHSLTEIVILILFQF